MPIVIKNCDWSQTTDEVIVKIPLLNIPTSKNLDSCISTNFVKLSYAPYYFEAFLLHPIVESCSTCLVLENEARFQLRKQDVSMQWESLEKVLTKAEKMLLKEESQREIFENAKNKRQSNRQWREDKKKAEVSREIHRESSMRESIEQLQENVCQSEMSMIKKATQPPIVSTRKAAAVKVEKAAPPVAIRQSGTIAVNFSGRKFITPQRESQEPAEAEWLLKQSAARKATGEE
jgi:dyslexia susceptibility 1 candidate gene 1 protein